MVKSPAPRRGTVKGARRRAPPATLPPAPPRPMMVAFASLPFGLRGGAYAVRLGSASLTVHVAELRYNPFMTIAPRPELAQTIPENGQGDGYTTYTWYDHPFVLRVLFGRNVASLGSVSSAATLVQPLPDLLTPDAPELSAALERFAEDALGALNALIAIVRRQARLYHVFDLARADIDISLRTVAGAVLREDPLQAALIRQEEAEADVYDLSSQGDGWYDALSGALGSQEAVSLADDLLIEAERALKQRFPSQAIATCHSTIEAAASALLTQGMQKRGLSDAAIDDALSDHSLPAKLDAFLRRFTGYGLKQDQPALWRAFLGLNDLRNEIVHRGGRSTDEQAAEAIRMTRTLLQWLAMVRERNRG